MKVRQTCVRFEMPKDKVKILDKVVFFHFGKQEASVPKSKLEIRDCDSDNHKYIIYIWKWVLMKTPILAENIEIKKELLDIIQTFLYHNERIKEGDLRNLEKQPSYQYVKERLKKPNYDMNPVSWT